MRRTSRSELIGRVDRAVRTSAATADVAIQVRHALIDLGQEDDLLDPAHLRPDAAAYQAHPVHVAPDGAFSIVSLVWLPGQATVPHDHRSWCVVGVHRGVERETVFRRADGGRLVAVAETRHEAGSTSLALPPEDVHVVENAGDDLAVSIHVYGLDVRAAGSIRRRYPMPATAPATIALMASATGSGSPSMTST